MTTNRWAKRQQRTRHDFMNAAIQLTLERGFDAVTVTDIAKLAGYGRGTFYQYFDDKEALAWAIMELHFDEQDRQILETIRGYESPVREYLSWRIVFENSQRAELFFRQIGGETADRLRYRLRAYLIQQFEGHVRSGTFSLMIDVDADIAARFIVGAIFEIADRWIVNEEARSAAYMADQFFRLVFRQPPPQMDRE
jgi:AcrR family transcriptional regulator